MVASSDTRTPRTMPRQRAADLDTGLGRLRLGNLVVGLIHLAQALAIFALSNGFTIPVTGSFLAGPPGTDPSPLEVLREVPLGLWVGVFLLLAAIDHLLMAAPGVWEWYGRNLRRGVNYARWWEYSVSASLMMVLIALVTGVTDAGALAAVFGVNAAMILFGLLMERGNLDRGGRPVDWTAYVFGCIAGAVPWAIVAYQIIGAEERGTDGGVPTFVYGIIVSLFLLFNSFAVNMLLQYAGVGRWRDYLFGERVYIVLSLIAKSALAWQIFANTLID